MLRAAFVLLLLPPLLSAAPVPKADSREKIEKRFGKIVDPKGDCKFGLSGDALTLTLPANEVRDIVKGVDTAPRVEREVTGDFVLTVTISAPLDAKAKVAKAMAGEDGVYPFVGGGVQFRGKKENGWFTHGLSRWNDGELKSGLPPGSPFAVVPKKYGSFDHCGHEELTRKNPEAVTLKFTRREENLSVDCYLDGNRLAGDIRHQGVTRDETLTVALFAQHGSDREHAVTFSEISLEPLKEKK